MTSQLDQLSLDSSLGDLLQVPSAYDRLEQILEQAGRSIDALKPLKAFSLRQILPMGQGFLDELAIQELLNQANRERTTLPGLPDAPAVETESELPSAMKGRFAGKSAVVTGAASGIGLAVAKRLLAEGAKVIALDINMTGLEEFEASVQTDALVPLCVDIRDDQDVAKVCSVLNGDVELLANVAGIMDDLTPVGEVSDEMWNRVYEVNVLGTMKMMRALVPLMVEKEKGSIVNVASEAGLRGSAAGVAYTASKHAVVGMTKSTAYMYATSGIRVNAVAPGMVVTGMKTRFASELGESRADVFLRTATAASSPADIAATICFLLSADARHVSGNVVACDNAWSTL